MAFLVLALLLVKRVRLSRWRSTLGGLISADEDVAVPCDARAQNRARAIAASIARADWRLPLSAKCLARAVALQWRLRVSRIPSRLVIAFHRTDRSGEDAFHAWVEQGGEMLIGRCDRASYRPIMIFAQGVPAFVSRPPDAR